MKKTLVIAGTATTLALAGVVGFGLHSVSADAAKQSTNPMASLRDAIATKFNLNKDEVQKVIDEQHSKMEADRTEQVKTELSKLVTDKKISQDQMDKILAKRTEMEKTREANHDAMQNKTDSERKTAMEKERADLETWAKSHNIHTEYLRYVMGGPGGRGHGNKGGMMRGEGHGMGMERDGSSSQSSASSNANN